MRKMSTSHETAQTTSTRYVEVDGNSIAYRSIGIGSPMIVLTRMRGTLDTWDPLFLDNLAESHRVITVDYPGIGYSGGTLPADMSGAAAFVAAFATAIDVPRFVVLGWSWGGLVSQTVVLEHPQRVSHAILIGCNPPGKVERPIQQAFLERAFKPVNDLADEEVLFFEPRSEVSRKAAKASRDRIYARPDVVSRIPARPEDIQAYIKAAAEFGVDPGDRRQKLTEARTPMLIVCGDNDISTAGQNWFPLIGRLRSAQLIVYPESGHGPQHQYPELTAQYVADFLRYGRS
jgi:pimeloyl-ACP methyl ester carboxylesterase